jgi:hypothetical protein
MVELGRLLEALNALENVMSAPSTTMAQLLGLAGPASDSVRPDEFFGLSALEGAKRYLRKRGEARPFTEILEAVRAGGARANGAELRISLARSTLEIAKVGQDSYGLLEFYPHIKRGRKREGAAPTADEQRVGETESTEEAANAPVPDNVDLPGADPSNSKT